MKDKTISALHDFSLEARELLQKELSEQLEGIYGLLLDGKLESTDKYPALVELPEARETRVRLQQFLEDQSAAGIKPKVARGTFTKETAFTWLNRFVAFKMMESRKLLRQTVSRGIRSNGFIMWLTEPGNEEFYEKHEQGDLPQNVLGEGPRQEAYRHFLLSQCEQLAQEISVLFDPDSLASRFMPRPRVLDQLIEMIGAEELEEAWAPGNEESIGWVYQYFNENEKKDVFERLYKKKQKIRKEDIPAATELFTPNWIVTWLVHNSLGRYWVQMHPDTNLVDELQYLVPLAGEVPTVPLKKVRDIKFLDPACGTMHFGLIAFDLFVEMYREELQNAGAEGWPEKPSVSNHEEIPLAILAYNIHGLDIDLRAVQLSALTLYLKAKSLNKSLQITESQLACSSVSHFDDSKLEQFIEDLKLSDSIYARILRVIWHELSQLEVAGSLLRPETTLEMLLTKEKEKFRRESERPHLPGFAPEQFETEAGEREFWEIIEKQIIQALHHYARNQAEQGRDESFFARETVKGFKVIDIMTRRYDVVATNPPYMARRNMNSHLASFLQRQYPKGKGDLYAAFIQRGAELLNDHGQLGMITQQSFMFISSYEKMRKELLQNQTIETMCHVGPRAFEAISGEKVNTTLFALRKEVDADCRVNSLGTYFRLVKEPDEVSKRTRFEEALQRLKAGEDDPLVFRYRQGDFDAILGSPWVYWITPQLRELFEKLPNLEKVARPRHGMSTGDNYRFVRFWWEAGEKRIGFGHLDHLSAESSGKKWFPYMKGGNFRRWFGNQDFVVNYQRRGVELIAAKEDGTTPGHRHDNPNFYFRRGVTYSYLTSGSFSARLSPGGFIFDVAGSSLFPEEIPLVLAIMNSTFAAYALKLINPTVNFQVGDLARLPIPEHASSSMGMLVTQAIDLAKAYSSEDETTYQFIVPLKWPADSDDLVERERKILEIDQEINEELYRLYGICAEDRRSIEAELAEPSLDGDSVHDSEVKDREAVREEDTPALTKEELARQWISYAVGILLGRFEPGVQDGLGRGRFSEEIAAKLLKLADPEGIMVMDEGHPDDLPRKVLEALTVMLGQEDAGEIVKVATGKQGLVEDLLRQYLNRQFFKLHIQQYRKRPVYWFLQSPKKKYGVWLFHERLTNDTLFRIRTEYVEQKIRLLEGRLAELKIKRDDAEGREKRKMEKEIGSVLELLEDVREFSKRVQFIIEERGYLPHIVDGVLLNIAPLWELMPSWRAEPKKAWEALERGDYDWSHQAMDHWPERVKEKCKTNKSYAIAHGLAKGEDLSG